MYAASVYSVIELVKDRATKEPFDATQMNEIRKKLLERGLFTFVNQNWVFVCPPLVITQEELLEGLGIIAGVIGDM